MASHVALLRGINVGGKNKVPMAELREVVTALGHTGVSTYIQSGNVLFTTEETDTAELTSALEAAIAGKFEINPKLVHVVFMGGEPSQELLDRIKALESAAAAKGSRDTITAIGKALYLHTPDGYGTSELSEALFRMVGTGQRKLAVTARNWSTSTTLLSLCEEK